MIGAYDKEGVWNITDECADCEYSYVDDLFLEWMCKRNRCIYPKANQTLFVNKLIKEMEGD